MIDHILAVSVEFRMASFQSLQHHAKVIFQYFVNLAVAGDSYASEKDAAYYKVAFRAFEKKLNGMKDSTVTSSVWRPNFKRALESYPEFNVITLEEAVEGCDACHIGGRMSKFIGQLGGDKYDRKTFSVSKPGMTGFAIRTQSRDIFRYCRLALTQGVRTMTNIVLIGPSSGWVSCISDFQHKTRV